MKYFIAAVVLASAPLSILPANAAEREHPYRYEDRQMDAHRDANGASLLHAWRPGQGEQAQPLRDDWRNNANGS